MAVSTKLLNLVTSSKTEIIEKLYTSEYTSILYNLCSDRSLIDDLRQEIALIVLNTAEEKLRAIKNYKAWIIVIVQNQAIGKTGEFYRKYRKNKFIELVDIDVQEEATTYGVELLNLINSQLEKNEFDTAEERYITLVYKSCVKSRSMNNLALSTGIPKTSIYRAIKSFKLLILERADKLKAYMDINAINDLPEQAKEIVFCEANKLNISPSEYLTRLVYENTKKNPCNCERHKKGLAVENGNYRTNRI